MTQFSHDVFLSYAREDNRRVAVGEGEETLGWVDAFRGFLERRHQEWTGRPLRVFLDRNDIKNGQDWEHRLFSDLRRSRLMIAFLSPAYLKSEYCRLEWDTYVRHEHSSARGFSGIKQLYYMRIPEFEGETVAEAEIQSWLANMRVRQATAGFQLTDWSEDPSALEEMLRLIDAKERLHELRINPRSANTGLINRIAEIDESIAETLDNTALAEWAVGRGNIPDSYSGFVGRNRELSTLHKALTGGEIGVVGALHGLGGQGKTALAVQYAYAYAGFYACGGRWLVGCSGKQSMLEVLEELAGIIRLSPPEGLSALPVTVQVGWYVEALKRFTMDALQLVEDMRAKLGERLPTEKRQSIKPRMLLILDNVDTPQLLDASVLSLLHLKDDWLEVVVTTRDDPAKLGGGSRISPIPIDDLPPEDALALLSENRAFANESERGAARELVDLLGGMTIVIDLVAAKLRLDTGRTGGATYASMLAAVKAQGITATDKLEPGVGADLRAEKRSRRVAFIVEDTLAAMAPEARTVLQFAAAFPPDMVVLDWVRAAVATVHPHLAETEDANLFEGDPWLSLVQELEARRILTPAATPEGALPGLCCTNPLRGFMS
jgi:hypothetical protein